MFVNLRAQTILFLIYINKTKQTTLLNVQKYCNIVRWNYNGLAGTLIHRLGYKLSIQQVAVDKKTTDQFLMKKPAHSCAVLILYKQTESSA
jgi:hypothetical protein